ncbi:pentapeptide repeat-containing protein [Actinosynnema sp. NPDC004786]
MGEQRGPTYKVLSTRAIVWFGVALVVVGAGVATALLLAYGNGTEADRARLDAIRTAGTIVVGTGGAAALWLAARRQQAAEIALRQKDVDQAHQEQDATERRVTELYTKAVEQLGSEKAPVRLGGMYALERLAQNVPDQRQTVVNVLCSYLRMPFQPPVAPDLVSTASAAVDALMAAPQWDKQATGEQAGPIVDRAENEGRMQEREVRLTAQRIITKHLHPGDDADRPARTFWEDIDLDLAGATLTAFDLGGCHVRVARFSEATFEGDAGFRGTTFGDTAVFQRATFKADAVFHGATFMKDAVFDGVAFEKAAVFGRAVFGNAAWFGGVRFGKVAWFDGVTFNGSTGFDGVVFQGNAWFDGATFEDDVVFGGVTFEEAAGFDRVIFGKDVWFDGATFGKGVELDSVRVRLDVVPAPNRNWPDGFSVVDPDPPRESALAERDGVWGHLVPVRDSDRTGEGG